MIHSLAALLLGIALFGSLTSTVFLCMTITAAIRFKRRTDPAAGFVGQYTPPVSLLKPLHGAEPGLEEFLESFFHLDYPQYEILFCARQDSDAGLQLARKVAARHPQVPVQFLLSGQPPWPNARCYSLSVMAPAAQHGILVITDSDVGVRPEFLREVVAPLGNPKVGAVTCLYVGAVREGGLWAQLEGLGMSVEMASGVLVAEMLEGMKFALGPAMIVRRSALESFGGFDKLGYYYADDFMLGNLVAQHGHEVVLSSHVIDHYIVNNSFTKNFSHQWNWMKSTRFSRPWGHLGTVLTFAAPFGILGFVAACMLGRHGLGLGLLALAYFSRVLQSAVVGGWVVNDRNARRFAWLYPVRDLLGFILWVASYTSRRLGWRDDRFVLVKGGLMRRV